MQRYSFKARNQLNESLNYQEQANQGSRLARINQIKENMMNNNNVEENKEKDMFLDFEIDFQQIMEHFANQVRPQIEKKYPGTPEEKIMRVINSKWNSIDSSKKQTYINKVKRKIFQSKMQYFKEA